MAWEITLQIISLFLLFLLIVLYAAIGVRYKKSKVATVWGIRDPLYALFVKNDPTLRKISIAFFICLIALIIFLSILVLS